MAACLQHKVSDVSPGPGLSVRTLNSFALKAKQPGCKPSNTSPVTSDPSNIFTLQLTPSRP